MPKTKRAPPVASGHVSDDGGELVYVGVGGNLGDREATFVAVVRALERDPGIELRAASPVYETDPLGPAGQDAYLNAVLEIRTDLGPFALLARLRAIENALGRDRGPRSVRWGPRHIDLDLLFYGDRRIATLELVVPHPRACERAFVMVPMADLAPHLRHPILGRDMRTLLAELDDRDSVRPWPAPDGWPGPATRARE